MEIFDKNEINSIINNIKEINRMALITYTPIADDLCSRIASADEVEHTLDWMLDFCGDDEMLLLFKRICRHYITTYPDIIASEITAYREVYE